MKYVVLVLSLCLLASCGPSEKVTVGEPGEKGILQRDIDQSKDTAAQASEQVKQGNKEAFGS